MPDEPVPSDEVIFEMAGQPLGNYELLEQIGEGGFGTVWKARQDKPVQRTVAVKIIKPGMDTREVIARFDLERQALAMMEHPAIATVFDAGATDTGRPFFVMELVDGPAVTQFCDAHCLETKARLELMIGICAAVQHAHQKGIIHRDLKPSNILVAGSRDAPQPKIIDFGVAKAIDPQPTEFTIHTGLEQFIGTPAYMSPEQARMGGIDIDTRSDIYSLGVLLYHLLTGTTPFAAKTTGATLEEVRRVIRDEPPPPPSTAVGRLTGEALTAVLAARKTALKELSLLLRRDLDWIVVKALEKDRERRYPTAAALAMDIRRYLAGEPVLARPPGIAYRTGKFIRKHQRQAAASAAILLALTGGLAASSTMAIREKAAVAREATERENVDRETGKIRTNSAKNAQTAKFLHDMLASINPDVAQGADLTLMRGILAKAAARVGTDLQGQPEVEAFLRNTIGGTYYAMGLYPEAKAQFEEGLKVAAKCLGPEDRLTLNFRGNLATLLDSRSEAEAEQRAILQLRERVFSTDDREAFATRFNLAKEIADQERFPEAEIEYQNLLRQQESVLGPDDPDTLRSRVALAYTRKAQGKDVVEEYRAAIEVMKGVSELGPDHPQTLEAGYGWGDALMAVGQFKEAREVHQDVLERRQSVLTPTHKKTLQSRTMVAHTLLRLNKAEEAETEFRAVLEQQDVAVRADRLKPDSEDILKNRIALGTAIGMQGKHADAETQFSLTIERMMKRGMSPNDPLVLTCKHNLAQSLAAQGKFPDAEELQIKVLEAREHHLDPTRRETRGEILLSMQSLIRILRAQGKTPEAQALESRLAERARK